MNKPSAIAAIAVASLVVLAACGSSGPKSSTDSAQDTTEAYSQKLTNAEPYPLSQMNDSAERANLRERLLRMNDPHKSGYVYTLTMTGQVIAEYTVKGKVSSTGSQLTNTNFPYKWYGNSSVGGVTTVDSMGDDGSYGPEEGGIFFFTTGGVLVEWNGLFVYSDAPLNLTSKPLITVDANAKPSSTAGQLK